MDIRFISSLTAEDENRFAPALLRAMGALLDQLPIAYTMRIETIDAQIFQRSRGGADAPEEPEAEAEIPRAIGSGLAIAGTPES